MRSRPSAAETADGWAALRDGRWGEARTAFERALAHEATPEGFEGLSWSAWWLDDRDAVFAARRSAYRLYRSRGEPAAAARMATWLAADELDFRGAVAAASGWLARARRLLDGVEPSSDHGWLAFHEGFLAHAGGDALHAQRAAVEAAEAGRRFAVADLEMLGLALEGAALVAGARIAEGMRRLDEATTVALVEEAVVPISSAWTFCFLVGACTATHDYERAYAWCDRIAEFAERWGSRYMLAFCRAEYGSLHVVRGRWQEAEGLLEAAVEDFAASRPAWTGGALVALADLRRRQGRSRAASVLLEGASASRGAQLVRALVALDDGEHARAAELVERLLRQVPPDRVLERLPCLELLVHARAGQGALDEARAALASLQEAGASVDTRAMRGRTELAQGAVAAAAGEHDLARTLFEDALDRFRESGMPFEEARARIELARSLAALGREKDADAEARGALERFRELGAEAEAARARRLLDARSEGAVRVGELTAREGEVLGLVTEGLTNRQIAERLVVSEHTVHRHVTNILRKLDAPSRAAAAAYAVRAGLVRSP